MRLKEPHTPLRCPTALSDHSPTALLPPDWPVWQKSCIEHTLRRAASSTAAWMFCACMRCNKLVALVLKMLDERFMHAALYFRSKQNLTISDKNSCILNMQRDITKWTQINSSWADITASLMPVLQNMKTRNDGTECIENQSAHSIPTLPHIALIC